MASESDSSQPLPEVSDVKTSTSTATEQINSYAVDSSSQPTTKVTDVKPHTSTVAKHPFFSLESHKVTVYPGRNVADILIVISNFSIPTGLRVAEASLLKQQLEIRKEEDDVKPSSLSKDSYAVYPYSIPKSWEIQSFVDKTLDLPNFSAEQRLNAINISGSVAMAYVMDQKAMLLQQSSWQNNVRMNNLVEQIRGPLSSIRTLSKMLAVTMKKNEIPYDIIEDIMVLGDHMKDTLQQLLEAVQVTKTLEVVVEEPAIQQALSNLIKGALLRTNVGAMVEIVSTSAPVGRALIIIDDDGPDMHYMCYFDQLDVICWKNLRSLSIAYGCLDEDLFQNILSGSPLLETLVLEACYGFELLDITNESVKNLVIFGFSKDIDSLLINAPYILSLIIKDDFSLMDILLLNMSSVIKVELDYSNKKIFHPTKMHEYHEMNEELLKALILSLTNVNELKVG
ncbi:chloroplast sensor kinase, chloroplastic [Tanacetum coccineum]